MQSSGLDKYRFDDVADDNELAAQLDRMSREECLGLYAARYLPMLLNLTSIFAGQMPPHDIEQLALRLTKRSVWSSRAAERYVRRQPEPEFHWRLREWNWDLIRNLASPKGLLLCTFRFGLYGYVPIELAAGGFEVVCPLAEAVQRGTQGEISALERRLADRNDRLPEGHPARNLVRLKVAEVESPRTVVELARVLRRGGVAVLYTDGNNGVDGPWGNEGRTKVPFFGRWISVKSGAAKLSRMLQCPILPIFALQRQGYHGEAVLDEPIFPAAARAAGQAGFIDDCMRQLYGLLEQRVRQNPDQWEGISGLHRWRREGACDEAPAEPLASVLERGATVRINQNRGVVRIPHGEGEMWIDSVSMKGFRPPPQATALLRALAERGGVNAEWIRQHGLEGDQATGSLLDRMWQQRLIACDSAGRSSSTSPGPHNRSVTAR